MHDDLLGELLEDERGYLNGSVPFEDRQVLLLLHNDGRPWEVCLALARSIVTGIAEIDRMGKAAAADDLLPVYNRAWREYCEADGQGGFVEVSNPEVGEDAFKAAISLVAVTILGDEVTTLDYDDGDLFAGHSIRVKSFEGEAFTSPRADLFG